MNLIEALHKYRRSKLSVKCIANEAVSMIFLQPMKPFVLLALHSDYDDVMRHQFCPLCFSCSIIAKTIQRRSEMRISRLLSTLRVRQVHASCR